jgi:hypothetical protein
MKTKDLILILFWAVLSTAISLVIAEYTVRWWFAEPEQQYSVPATGQPYGFYQYDPVLGWKNAPMMHGMFKREQFKYNVSNNSHGLRQAEVPLVSDHKKPRIAFMGDSFLWGIGVDDEQRYSEKVAEQSCVESLNFGVSGYGPVQYYLMLDKVIAFRPDLVVLGFTYDNEFEDNVLFERYGYYKPYATLKDGKLEIAGYPIPNVQKFGTRSVDLFLWDWLNESVLLKKTMELFQKEDKTRPKQQGLKGFNSTLLYRYPSLKPGQRKVADTAIKINKMLLQRIHAKLTQAGIPLVVVGIHSKCELYSPCTAWSSGPADVPLHSKISEIMERMTDELGIAFVNTFPHMQPEDFWKKDGHWNPQGHQKAAGIISEYLKTKNMMCH